MTELNPMLWPNQLSSTEAAFTKNRQKMMVLVVVLALHGALIGLMFIKLKPSVMSVITPPTIQAVMIVAQQAPPPPPKKIPPPPKPSPTPPKPQNLPVARIAPPSAKAITVPVNQTSPIEKIPETTVQAVEEIPVATPVAVSIKEAIEEITPPRSEAAHLNNPAPSYPSMSRRLGEQGRVVLEVYILANGTVGEVKLKQSSGFKRLDDAAIQAVKKWHYQAARRGQQAIDFWYVQPVSFSLN